MMMKKTACNVLGLVVLAICFVRVDFVAAQTDFQSVRNTNSAQITKLLKSTWAKPGQPLDVKPVVTAGDYGVAGWVQGDRGGRALLKRRDGAWHVIACAGDGFKSAIVLKETGVPRSNAETIAKALAAEEEKLSLQVREKFSSFEGVIRMHQNRHD